LRRALPGRGAPGARRRGHRVRGLAAQRPGARRVRRVRRHRAHPAAAVRRGAARHPDDPRVRGAGVRDPADLLALGRQRRALHARCGLPGCAGRRRAAAAAARRARGPRAGGPARRARPAQGPRPPHLRAPRGRAAAHPRRPRGESGGGGGGMSARLAIAFFGSSLVSAYWNGAATYYRGLLRALAARGHRITFYEPDAYGRQQHRDMPDPEWARVVVYPGTGEAGVLRALESARGADLVVKASGVGVFDELLEEGVLALRRPGTLV